MIERNSPEYVVVMKRVFAEAAKIIAKDPKVAMPIVQACRNLNGGSDAPEIEADCHRVVLIWSHEGKGKYKSGWDRVADYTRLSRPAKP